VVLSPAVTRSINRELRQIDRDFRTRVKAIRAQAGGKLPPLPVPSYRSTNPTV
jgi:hypothetical protein